MQGNSLAAQSAPVQLLAADCIGGALHGLTENVGIALHPQQTLPFSGADLELWRAQPPEHASVPDSVRALRVALFLGQQASIDAWVQRIVRAIAAADQAGELAEALAPGGSMHTISELPEDAKLALFCASTPLEHAYAHGAQAVHAAFACASVQHEHEQLCAARSFCEEHLLFWLDSGGHCHVSVGTVLVPEHHLMTFPAVAQPGDTHGWPMIKRWTWDEAVAGDRMLTQTLLAACTDRLPELHQRDSARRVLRRMRAASSDAELTAREAHQRMRYMHALQALNSHYNHALRCEHRPPTGLPLKPIADLMAADEEHAHALTALCSVGEMARMLHGLRSMRYWPLGFVSVFERASYDGRTAQVLEFARFPSVYDESYPAASEALRLWARICELGWPLQERPVGLV